MALVSVELTKLQLAPKLNLLRSGPLLVVFGFRRGELRGLPPLRDRGNVNEFPLSTKARFARGALPSRSALPWSLIRRRYTPLHRQRMAFGHRILWGGIIAARHRRVPWGGGDLLDYSDGKSYPCSVDHRASGPIFRWGYVCGAEVAKPSRGHRPVITLKPRLAGLFAS